MIHINVSDWHWVWHSLGKRRKLYRPHVFKPKQILGFYRKWKCDSIWVSGPKAGLRAIYGYYSLQKSNTDDECSPFNAGMCALDIYWLLNVRKPFNTVDTVIVITMSRCCLFISVTKFIVKDVDLSIIIQMPHFIHSHRSTTTSLLHSCWLSLVFPVWAKRRAISLFCFCKKGQVNIPIKTITFKQKRMMNENEKGKITQFVKKKSFKLLTICFCTEGATSLKAGFRFYCFEIIFAVLHWESVKFLRSLVKGTDLVLHVGEMKQ